MCSWCIIKLRRPSSKDWFYFSKCYFPVTKKVEILETCSDCVKTFCLFQHLFLLQCHFFLYGEYMKVTKKG